MATRALPSRTAPLPFATASERRSAAGTLALSGLVASIALLALSAAAAPTSLVSTDRTMPHYFPVWLAGPLHVFGLGTSAGLREGAVIAFCGCYALALRCAGDLSARRLSVAIVLAHLAALLAPPLLSGDVFGYVGFARLGVVHGLNPYLASASAAPNDPIHPLLGWTNVTTPYGPLFTLFSEALVPLGIAGAVWTFKVLAALTSLATVAVIWRLAGRMGASPRRAIAFYGLNPLVIVYAVAGAHNETLFGLLIAAGALLIVAGSEVRGGIALAGAAAIKASAGLVLPFALLGARRRRRASAAVAASLAAALVVGIAVFGPHLASLTGGWLIQQHEVAGHSIPSQVSKLLGLGELHPAVRAAFLALFGGVLALTLWRTWRGASWLDSYGWATLALLAASAWLWPWYGLWALLPASASSSRRLRAVTLGACAYLVAITVLVSRPLLA